MTIKDRALTAQQSLFNRYDQLNSLWEKAEQEITQIHVPHPVSYQYHSILPGTDTHTPEEEFYLGLQKIKGKWRICHGCTYCHQGEPDWTPITECSAEFRVQAVSGLRGFNEKVVASAEEFIPKVDEAIQVLTGSLGLQGDQRVREILEKRKKFVEESKADRAKLNGQLKK